MHRPETTPPLTTLLHRMHAAVNSSQHGDKPRPRHQQTVKDHSRHAKKMQTDHDPHLPAPPRCTSHSRPPPQTHSTRHHHQPLSLRSLIAHAAYPRLVAYLGAPGMSQRVRRQARRMLPLSLLVVYQRSSAHLAAQPRTEHCARLYGSPRRRLLVCIHEPNAAWSSAFDRHARAHVISSRHVRCMHRRSMREPLGSMQRPAEARPHAF